MRKQARQRERQLRDESFARTFDAKSEEATMPDGSTMKMHAFVDARGKKPSLRQADSLTRILVNRVELARTNQKSA